ncbi:MAG: AbrB/MazE/SpoVT family DNA-binding domain-containing protein [Euryarchaeota archaeon]|nr:AbrB/MazE/SpoVT family DNA-binding domain-containing protein [Euryarchaeota archaeon]
MEAAEVKEKGRITIPKEVREFLGIKEGDEVVFIKESPNRVTLLPRRKYDDPVSALYGSIKVGREIEHPKKAAREWIRKQSKKEIVK